MNFKTRLERNRTATKARGKYGREQPAGNGDGRTWLDVAYVIFVAFLIAAGLAVLLIGLCGCGDPCDARPGYEHPKTSHEPRTASGEPQAASHLWRVTAYCPCKICCGPRACGVTASGLPARGKLVAAPREIPFGLVIDVPGYGLATVADRGGAIRDNRLDVLMPTHAAARAWGVKYVECRVESAE